MTSVVTALWQSHTMTSVVTALWQSHMMTSVMTALWESHMMTSVVTALWQSHTMTSIWLHSDSPMQWLHLWLHSASPTWWLQFWLNCQSHMMTWILTHLELVHVPWANVDVAAAVREVAFQLLGPQDGHGARTDTAHQETPAHTTQTSQRLLRPNCCSSPLWSSLSIHHQTPTNPEQCSPTQRKDSGPPHSSLLPSPLVTHFCLGLIQSWLHYCFKCIHKNCPHIPLRRPAPHNHWEYIYTTTTNPPLTPRPSHPNFISACAGGWGGGDNPYSRVSH